MYKSFLYFLLDKDGKSYVANGKTVSTVAQATQLPQVPEGWQDLLLAWERDMEKWGIINSFSFPLSFIGDGATIIRTILYTKNIEEPLYLYIAQFRLTLDDNYFYPKYHYLYRSLIDLSTFSDDGVKATVKLADKSLNAKLKANAGTTYEFPLDDAQAVSIKMTGLPLVCTFNFYIPKVENITNTVPISFIGKDGTPVNLAAYTQSGTSTIDQSFLRFIDGDSIKVHLSGKLSFIPNNHVQEVHVVLYRKKGNDFSIIQQDDFKPVSEGASYTANYDRDITLLAQEELYLVCNVIQKVGAYGGIVTFQETELKVTSAGTYRTTNVKAIRPTVLLKKLIGQITGSEDNAASELLSKYDNLLITCGDSIRGLRNAKLKTNFNDFYSTWKAILGAGAGVEFDKVIIEKRSHFFDATDPIPLGKIANLKVSFASDLLGNTIKIGYNSQQIDDVNGKYSFSNTHEYRTPITLVQKELSFISPYLSDPYYIETIRINLDGKTTTDNKADNELFILNTVATGVEFTGGFAVSTSTFLGAVITLFSVSGAPDKVDLFKAGVVFTVSGSLYNNKTFTVTVDAGLDPNTNIFTFLVAETANQDESALSVTLSTQTYELYRPTYDSVSGIPQQAASGIFNIEQLTPKRMLLQQMDYLNSIYKGFEGQRITFGSTEKNAELKTVLGGTTIEEKANQDITANRLFLPFYVEFDTEVPIDLADTLEQYPNKAFSFEWEENIYIGFLIKAGLAPNDLKPQTFKLLLAPNNDLSKLIP